MPEAVSYGKQKIVNGMISITYVAPDTQGERLLFKNPMTTAAAIDRLVHHSAILEFSGRSKRADEAESRTKNPSPEANS
jgi:hypothetical protein